MKSQCLTGNSAETSPFFKSLTEMTLVQLDLQNWLKEYKNVWFVLEFVLSLLLEVSPLSACLLTFLSRR